LKKYLSYGGGVNSTALLVMGGYDEAIYVDHGCDWPETREYVRMIARKYPVTILEPGSLYDYAWGYKMVPSPMIRWCTKIFKVTVVNEYVKKPCWMWIGFSLEEAKRANMTCEHGIEYRWPLIEQEIDREGCKEIIRKANLPVPIKSGCYFCPYQTIKQWKELRHKHPDLFCKAEQLEKRNMDYRESKGKTPLYLYSNKKPLRTVVNETQGMLFKEMEYPPCNCELE
jgi:hypothetical protein